jgi:hypothetical protein
MPSRYVTVEGQFAREVLGAFSIIRGFASLQDLARISSPYQMTEPDPAGLVQGHQRQLDTVHAEEIRTYFEKGDRQFIPEVILSVRVSLQDIVNKGEKVGVSHTGTHGIRLTKKYTSRGVRIHELRVEAKKLNEIKKAARIRRIDGNHRLALADKLAIDPARPNRYLVPFCLLLLGDVGEPAFDYTESLVFHIINSTGKTLDSEHALKLILGQPVGLTMPADKEFAFNPALHLTRLLVNGFGHLPEPARSRLGNRPRSVLANAAKEMLTAYPAKKKDLATLQAFAQEIVGALNDLCNRLWPNCTDFCQSEFFIELAAHTWMKQTGANHEEHLQAAVRFLEQMSGWLGHEGLRKLQSGQPLGKQLLDVYEEIRKRIPQKVFLARWYPVAADGEELNKANLRLEQIRRALEDLRQAEGINLELIDMGTATGGTEMIHPKMYEAIKSSGIILIDLSGVRPNVCVETGYALKHHEQGRLLFIFEPTAGFADPPFDLRTFRYEKIAQAAEIPGKIKPHITTIVKQAGLGAI